MPRMPRLRRMPRLAALVLVLAASPFAACQCGSKQEPPRASSSTGSQAAAAPTPGDPSAPAAPGAEIPAAESVRRITELADKICACADRACAEATRVALEEQNRKDAGRPRAKPTPAETDAMRGQAKRIADCVEQLR